MSHRGRRFFSGQSLAQAVVRAARWYGVEPERLAYRVREKRHGFVKLPRAVVIEVDPEAPSRAAGAPAVEPAGPVAARSGHAEAEPAAGGAARAPTPARGERESARTPRPERRERETAIRARRETRRPAEPAAGADAERWHAPDAESELAAAEAAARLLRLAGVALEPRVRRLEDRLEIDLVGADQARLAQLGLRFLESVEHVLPRAVHGLCGRLVRVRVEGAELRSAHEDALRALARAAAERVVESGREEELGPLPPAERRIVHLELAGVAGVATESVGGGYLKRLRIVPRS